MNGQFISGLLAPVVEAAIASALSGSSDAQRDLKLLDGKLIALELKEMPFRLYFLFPNGKLAVHGVCQDKPDMTVRVPTAVLLKTVLKQGGDAPSRNIELNGDAETAQIFSRVLKQTNLDWEELLSHYVGDIASHQVGKFVHGLTSWSKDTASRLGRDIAEYLQYETRNLPPRFEVDAFLDGVDHLKSDVDRLAARLKKCPSRRRLRDNSPSDTAPCAYQFCAGTPRPRRNRAGGAYLPPRPVSYIFIAILLVPTAPFATRGAHPRSA